MWKTHWRGVASISCSTWRLFDGRWCGLLENPTKAAPDAATCAAPSAGRRVSICSAVYMIPERSGVDTPRVTGFVESLRPELRPRAQPNGVGARTADNDCGQDRDLP